MAESLARAVRDRFDACEPLPKGGLQAALGQSPAQEAFETDGRKGEKQDDGHRRTARAVGLPGAMFGDAFEKRYAGRVETGNRHTRHTHVARAPVHCQNR